MPEFSNKTHYNAEEAARELDRSAPEIENLILSGRLQTEIVDGKRIIPAQALDDFHAGISSPDIKARVMLEEGKRQHNRVSEAAQRLDKPVNQVRKMVAAGLLVLDPSNDRLVEPDQTTIQPGNSDAGESHNVDPEGAYYYSPSQAAELLSTNLLELNTLVNRGELPAVSIDKHRWLPAKAIEDLVRQRYGPGKLRHAPQPHRIRKSEKQRSEETAEKNKKAEVERPGSPSVQEEATVGKSNSHYDVNEVSQKLGKPHHEVWRMGFMGTLQIETISDQRLFLKQSVDDFLRSKKSAANVSNGVIDASASAKRTLPLHSGGDSYYSIKDAAERLEKSPDDVWEMVYRGKLPVSTVDGERVFPKRVIDDLVLGNHPGYAWDTTYHPSQRQRSNLQTSQEAAVTEDRYYAPGQAAQLLGKDASEIAHMIHRKELPVLRINSYQWIPEKSVENLLSKSAQRRWQRHEKRPKAYRIRQSEIQKAPSLGQKEQEVDQNLNESRNSLSSTESETPVRHSSSGNASQVPSPPSQPSSETKLEEVEMLRDELRAEGELNQRLTQELKQERADYAQDIQNARYEIDQSNAEIENLRRDYAVQSETLQEDLEEERRRRLESELRAEELQDQLEEEKRPRTGVKGVVESLKGLISYEEDDDEEQRRDLELALEHSKRELEEEKNRQRKNEELFGDLQSKLERNEAKNRELENALSSEMAKTLRLEEEKRVLDEVRRVLGADTSRPSEHAEATTPVDSQRGEPDDTNNELLIDTQYGRWNFRPPFALEKDEIDLIRLVAGAEEMTAEQIYHRTKRRRAANDLDDLLERLAYKGMVPIRKENDRYNFDPDFLQDR